MSDGPFPRRAPPKRDEVRQGCRGGPEPAAGDPAATAARRRFCLEYALQSASAMEARRLMRGARYLCALALWGCSGGSNGGANPDAGTASEIDAAGNAGAGGAAATAGTGGTGAAGVTGVAGITGAAGVTGVAGITGAAG